MQVTIDKHSGFCAGVTGAIRRAENELQQTGQLYCLGDIVHNGQEVKRLEDLGLETIDYDDLRTIHHARVLLRAHGEPPSTYWIAEQNGNTIIDGTCPVVKRLQERIAATYNAHKHDDPRAQIVIFGKRGHAEVIGLQGQTNNTAIVVEKPEEADALDFTRPIYLFSQTTKSIEDFHRLAEKLKSEIRNQKSDTILEVNDTICRAVANRVEQLKQFAREQDVVLFVGGTKSSNAAVLFNHCKDANAHSYFLTSPEDLTQDLQDDCRQADKVGICGATSTPLWLMEQVRDKLTKLT
ncbi:MAG: 4-hydroxy-3-methylbut-2-enyl diphosphate reductase [Paludibacteraceae bacterium]|nr:4-hydroxy-3-methylbut-2-enyl diphosphate reductase [Paludibacteraceae bacterium]